MDNKACCYLIWCLKDTNLAVEVGNILEEKIDDKKIALTVEKDKIKFTITHQKQLNVNKVLKDIQKLLIKIPFFGCKVKVEELIEDEKNWLVITPPTQVSESPRLKKIIASISETSYYDVGHLYGPEPSKLEKHLFHRNIGIIDWNERVFLVDEKALMQKINLNCMACTSKYTFGCCCGSPCNYSRKNLKVYKEHEKAIIEQMKQIEPAFYKQVLSELGVSESQLELVGFDGSVGECGGRCILLVREDGMAKCLSHKYALENELPVYEISPLSCLMFPFEVIDCMTNKGRRILLLTSVVDDEIASEIGRWGSYKHLEMSLNCIDESCHNEEYRKEDYKPVYKVNKGLITHEFGGQIYDAVCEIVSQ